MPLPPINSYEDLIAWQRAYELTIALYRQASAFPPDERFGLTSQMRRAAVSIPSNIAEGWGRNATADYERFLRMARGSAYELHTQIRLAIDLQLLKTGEPLLPMIIEVERLLNGLLRSLQTHHS
ncbi:MAG: four helix bundle protein [Phycisphaeraceae bacterium]